LSQIKSDWFRTSLFGSCSSGLQNTTYQLLALLQGMRTYSSSVKCVHFSKW